MQTKPKTTGILHGTLSLYSIIKRLLKKTQVFPTIAAIDVDGLQVGDKVFVSAYSEDIPVGGGCFTVVEQDVTPDGGTYFKAGNVSLMRYREDGVVRLSDYGVYAEMPTNQERFQKAVSYCGSTIPLKVDGVYKVSGVHLPRNFRLFGIGMTESPRFGDVSNWKGFDLSFYKGNSLLYAEEGVILTCEEGVQLRDFDMAGCLAKGLTGEVNPTTLQESAFNDVTAIKYNKYIVTHNVGISLMRKVLHSVEFGGNKGDYYSEHFSIKVYYCFEFLNVESVANFNMKIYSPRISAARLFRANLAFNNMVFFGGSVEGFTSYSGGDGMAGEVTFNGTYFETFGKVSGLDAFYFTGSMKFTFRDCLIYLNGIQNFVRSNTASSGGLVFDNNRFVLRGGDVKSVTLLNTGGAAPSFTYSKASNNRFEIGDGYAVTEYAYRPKIVGLSSKDEFISFNAGGVSLRPLSQQPDQRIAGAVYCADGVTWNPLSRSGGQPYWVLYWDGSWKPVSGG